MGLVYAEIELISAEDIGLARRYIIGDEEIKQTRVLMLVDTGAFMMAINENIQAHLDLGFQYRTRYALADGKIAEYDVVGPVKVKFANREASCNAVVLPGDSEPLLGAIPMEEMDVLIHPSRQELIVNPEHQGSAVHRLPSIRPAYMR